MFARLTCTWSLPALLVAACGPGGETSQCKEALLPGDLILTEVFADAEAIDGGSGADEGREWFEFYNASGRAIDLEGLTVRHARPDGSRANFFTLDSFVVEPGDYVVLGNTLPELVPAFVDIGYADTLGDLFNTDGGRFELTCGTTTIDLADYDAVESGVSRQFDGGAPPDYTANDDLANWCGADPALSEEFSTNNFGTPGDANQDCEVVVAGQCNDGGTMRPTVAPQLGDLVITEYLTNPMAVADDTGEWFEIQANANFDLNGLQLDRLGDGADATVVASEDCLPVSVGDYVVFAKSTDSLANGGLPNVAGTFTFSLVDGSVASPGDIWVGYGGALLDAVAWTDSSTGESNQLDPDFATPEANDMERYFCVSTQSYGAGDLGTPGLGNDQCAILPPTGQCLDNGTERAIETPAVGDLVISEWIANPAGTDGDEEWFEITNVSGASFDLNDLLLDRAGDSTAANRITSSDCLSVGPGDFALFARNPVAAENAGLPTVDATFSFSIVPIGDIQVLDGATVLDAVTWPSAAAAASTQVMPGALSTTGNDDPLNHCVAAVTYGTGTNRGTPKAANVCP